MARLAELVGNTKRHDLFRVAKNEKLPYRGRKKHFSQMTNQEINHIWNALRSVKKWNISSHALDRVTQKGIQVTYRDIITTIHNATIIEYHIAKFNDEKDNRVLLRSKAIANKYYNLNVVYSLTRKEVVSVWLNHINDRHETIDMSDYTKSLRIF
jgi:hypothetical protein